MLANPKSWYLATLEGDLIINYISLELSTSPLKYLGVMHDSHCKKNYLSGLNLRPAKNSTLVMCTVDFSVWC